MKVVSHTIGRKTALWLPGPNKYVLADPVAGEMARQINDGLEKEAIVDLFVKTRAYPEEKIIQAERELRQLMEGKDVLKQRESNESSRLSLDHKSKSTVFTERFYHISDQIFRVTFSSVDAELIIHPKFAHLQGKPVKSPNHQFRVFHANNHYTLNVNGEWIGTWPEYRDHFFAGMFSQKLLEKIYAKKVTEWMGVFHASAVNCENSCLLFAGDSGSGKSTLAALLFSRGFDVLADDFVPVESESGRVFRFPAALSVKKGAAELLSASFGDLKKAKEFHFQKTGKSVKYLDINYNTKNLGASVPVNGLVFVNYSADCRFQLEELSPEEAFAHLVPDSWIYPSEENATRFLKWFSNLRCFMLTYSDNEMMVAEIKKLFQKVKPETV